MGNSAGAHLAALVALAPDQFGTEYRGDPNAAAPANVKAMVGFYGVYDMAAQWQHDQIARPTNSIAEKFLGTSLIENRRIYLDSLPVSYATVDRNRARFLLMHGPTTRSIRQLSRKPFRMRSTRLASSSGDS
jgi:hypothetical protein